MAFFTVISFRDEISKVAFGFLCLKLRTIQFSIIIPVGGVTKTNCRFYLFYVCPPAPELSSFKRNICWININFYRIIYQKDKHMKQNWYDLLHWNQTGEFSPNGELHFLISDNRKHILRQFLRLRLVYPASSPS